MPFQIGYSTVNRAGCYWQALKLSRMDVHLYDRPTFQAISV
jgi:hypothetical protein